MLNINNVYGSEGLWSWRHINITLVSKSIDKHNCLWYNSRVIEAYASILHGETWGSRPIRYFGWGSCGSQGGHKGVTGVTGGLGKRSSAVFPGNRKLFGISKFFRKK